MGALRQRLFTTFMSERMDFDKAYHHPLFNQDTLRSTHIDVSRAAAPMGTSEAPGEPPLPGGGPSGAIEGRSPTYLAWRRLRRNKVALASPGCSSRSCSSASQRRCGRTTSRTRDRRPAPHRKDHDPWEPDLRRRSDGIPLGPGLHWKFLLGADQSGRDVMVRLMYGGRTSLYIGIGRRW